MIVTHDNFLEVIETVKKEKYLGIDVETYGLLWKHKIFSVQVSLDSGDDYYFNFYSGEDYLGNQPPSECILTSSHMDHFHDLFGDTNKVWFAHNAKFEMNMFAKSGLYIKGTVYCTKVLEKLLRNNYWDGYSLAACAKRRKLEKLDNVDKIITKNKLFEVVKVPGKKKPIKEKHFYRVPFEELVRYGTVDSRLALTIGMEQIEELRELSKRSKKTLRPLIENETRLLRTLARMEQVGVQIDPKYCQKALSYVQEKLTKNRLKLQELAGIPLDTVHFMKTAFDNHGYKYTLSEKGNPEFNKKALDRYDNPIANQKKICNQLESYLSSYYSTFLYVHDTKNVIHASFDQAGTDTGRFSSNSPNLQNVPKEDDDEFYDTEKHPFIVRECFVPRQDYCFVAYDYSQMEYRLMVDYAGEMGLIEEILGGKDVHTATADLIGTKRKTAKTINFLLLYGGGDQKLADALGVSLAEATHIKERYFYKLPKVQRLLEQVKGVARSRGHIFNWYGRRCYCGRNEDYKMPNYLIQGGCADIVKISMNRIDEYLLDKKSRLILNVHDDNTLEVHKDELYIQPEITKIMESVYVPQNGLPMAVDAEHSWKSWAHRDMEKGYARIT